MEKNPRVKGGINKAFDKAVKANLAISFLLENPSYPSLILNMEEIAKRPDVFLTEFTQALSLEGDVDHILNQISQKGYKSSQERDQSNFFSSRQPTPTS